jgi:hypothetical protein
VAEFILTQLLECVGRQAMDGEGCGVCSLQQMESARAASTDGTVEMPRECMGDWVDGRWRPGYLSAVMTWPRLNIAGWKDGRHCLGRRIRDPPCSFLCRQLVARDLAVFLDNSGTRPRSTEHQNKPARGAEGAKIDRAALA